MSRWTTQKLKEVTTKIGSGATPRGGDKSYLKKGIPLIRSLNIYDLKFDHQNLAYINKDQAQKLDNVMVINDDILLNITGASVCRCTSVPDDLVPARVNQHVSIIRPNKRSLASNFLKYLLVSPQCKKQLLALARTGATREALTKNNLENFEIILPDLDSQTRIGHIISAYDDLIENNEKRIKILEEMAQRLYNEWFVKFKFPGHENVQFIESNTKYGKIPEGWRVSPLGDRLTIRKGKNITKNTITEGSIPVVAGGIEPAYYHNQANAYDPVITVSASGANAGYIGLYQQDLWASDCSFIDKNVTETVYYYYLCLKTRQKEVNNLQRGSAQPHVYPKDLATLLIIDPPDQLVSTFENIIVPSFDLIRNLKNQNRVLTQIRDLLIPQLVTGKRQLKGVT